MLDNSINSKYDVIKCKEFVSITMNNNNMILCTDVTVYSFLGNIVIAGSVKGFEVCCIKVANRNVRVFDGDLYDCSKLKDDDADIIVSI